MIENLMSAFMIFLDIKVIAALFVGSIIGIFFSAVPGLTGTLALALLLPFTYDFPTEIAFVFIIGMLGGTVYGGSMTAIAINVPGAPSSIVTAFDGYPMFKKGRGGEAIGLATMSSVVGGIFSAVILVVFGPQLGKLALKFGPPEYFTLALFGLVAVIMLGDNKLKSIMTALMGLLLGTVGIDLFGTFRYNFGLDELSMGVPLIPVVVGLFAISQIIEKINKPEMDALMPKETPVMSKVRLPGLSKMKKLWKSWLRGSVIGSFIGFLPGAGGSIAAFVGYNVEKKVSKHPEKFGQGAEEGIAVAESANNATVGGTLIPTITLGIPGDQFTAIMLSAFLIHGLPVGPLLFRDNQELINVIFISTFLTNFAFLIVGLLGAKYLIKIALVRTSLLLPTIGIIALAGSFAAGSSTIYITYGIIFGVLGFLFKIYNFDIAPLILGLILSDIMESAYVQSLMISGGSFSIFFTRPFSVLFIVLAIVFVSSSFINFKKILRV